jgi:hypothetical protein
MTIDNENVKENVEEGEIIIIIPDSINEKPTTQ